jgi:hypothetical protein
MLLFLATHQIPSEDHYWSSYTAEVGPEWETKDVLLDPANAQKEMEL